MERPRVLIVDDEPGVRESVRMVLKAACDPLCVASGEEALQRLAEEKFDVVLLDVVMPGMDGLETLEKIRALSDPPQVIMLTATKTVKTAVRAMKLGAFDYLAKPFDVDELALVVQRAAEVRALHEEVRALRSEVSLRYRIDNIVGHNAGLRQALETVGRVAGLKTTVLITGESGTGKEVIAKAIHHNSPRADRPLITLNCAAIPENLLESELFGHERGAFTDAHARKIGQFEAADRGTIFLDEIGEMSPSVQAKLLRVIEQGTFTRVGGTQPVKVDVRILAATNRDLKKAIADGTFRGDLYYRLNVVSIHLPPLRERKEDIPQLVSHFLRLKSRALGLEEKPFDQVAIDLLIAHNWPGNVRELENVVERALVLSRGPVLTADDLPSDIATEQTAAHLAELVTGSSQNGAWPVKSLDAAVEELEVALIRRALAECNNNQTRAAEILGTTRRILKYKIDKLGLGEHLPVSGVRRK